MLESVIVGTSGLMIKLSTPKGSNVTTNMTVTISNETYAITEVGDVVNITGLYENIQYDIVATSTNCAGSSSTILHVWTCKFEAFCFNYLLFRSIFSGQSPEH